jgi:hypothetical protein
VLFQVQGGDTEEQDGNEQGAAAVVAYKMNDEEVA